MTYIEYLAEYLKYSKQYDLLVVISESVCSFSKDTLIKLFLEKEMATHSSILSGIILWTEEPGGLQSMGSQRVGHD